MEGQAPNLDELNKNLRHQLSLYRQLVDLLRVEKEFIVGVKLKEIRESTYSKEAILDEIHREELRRRRWIKEAADFLKISEKEITVEIVATKLANPADYESLVSLKNTLLHFIKKAQEMNLEIRALTENALNDAQALKRNILGLTSDRPQTYGPKGSMGGGAADRGARFISKEA